MSNKTVLAMFIAGGILTTSAAYADHNSIWGAGSANMPNDIHNTRIEDDNQTFLDLVQQGGGADSVNRYADDTTNTTMRSANNISGRSSMTSRMGSRSVAMNRGGRR